jgi:hypothetical protein
MHNAVIGMAYPAPPWPRPLGQAGYGLERVEQPIGTSVGRVVADLVFVASKRSAVLAVECKEGSVQQDQADAYAAIQPLDIVQTASLSLADPAAAVADIAYAVGEGRIGDTLRELRGRPIGVLGVGSHISWNGPAPKDPLLQQVFAHPIDADLRAIPRLLLVDDHSSPKVIAVQIANEIQHAIEQNRESVTVSSLLEGACWGWPRFGRALRSRLQRETHDLLRAAARGELEGVIQVERQSGHNSDPTIRVIQPPPDVTTQAGELRAARAVRAKLDNFVGWATGQPVPAVPGQMQLDVDMIVPDDDDE